MIFNAHCIGEWAEQVTPNLKNFGAEQIGGVADGRRR